MRWRFTKSKLVIGAGCVGLAAIGMIWGRYGSVSHATAKPPAEIREPAPVVADAPNSPSTEEYEKSAVAYIFENVGITRAELGEYLIVRMGADHLNNLINKRIIEDACRARGIEVTAGEVLADLQDTLKGLKIPVKDFEARLLKPRGKTLYEWKEDVIKPRLYMSKFCADRVRVAEEDILHAFEANFGEKIDCRLIHWPGHKMEDVRKVYAKIRDDEDEFERASRAQLMSSLASTAGQVKPMGRYATSNDELEKAAFSLKAGEMSLPVTTHDGIYVIKCIKRIPADTTKSVELVRKDLAKDVLDKKLLVEIPRAFAELHKSANPQTFLEKVNPVEAKYESEYSQRVVAVVYGTTSITRKDLGEHLIARFGMDRINNLVNRRIIERDCRQKGIEIAAAEVEADFAITLGKTTLDDFETTMLKPNHTTLYEWKEDVIRPRLLLTKLCRDRVQVTEEDLQTAFKAYHGEKVECRLIMWPKNESKIAINQWAKIRNLPGEFDRIAETQASPSLAGSKGKIAPIGRNTTGNEALERAAFSLQPGELSQLIDTPDGVVVLKCVGRVPPDEKITLEQERERLTKEIFDKKLQAEIPRYFAELREQARAKVFFKKGTTEEELKRAVHEELRDDTTSSIKQVGGTSRGN